MSIFDNFKLPQVRTTQPAATQPAEPVMTAYFFYHGGGESAPVLHKQSGVQMTAQGQPAQVIAHLLDTRPDLDAEYGWRINELSYAVLINKPRVFSPQ